LGAAAAAMIGSSRQIVMSIENSEEPDEAGTGEMMV
jgi:hypothetical protein